MSDQGRCYIVTRFVRQHFAAPPESGTNRFILKKVLLIIIAAYRRTLSPLLGARCRFHPSCSVYASEAIRIHGAARGSWLTVKRLARCHPLCEGGHDPVPGTGDPAA